MSADKSTHLLTQNSKNLSKEQGGDKFAAEDFL
jgi:hypothetical protein